MFGKLLSTPIRLLNAPLRAVENLTGAETEDDRLLSRPAEELAKEVEQAVDGKKRGEVQL
ncbi:hypothetical protein JN531_003995 [Flagellatimonas centrodinii]|uniref:hypothetical protein n=1 Tax=Flagellatimonas centrodinii TaxID=2806210 RepID=UPI001FF84D6F|nr:hypothetical protein [Flagellatimonas centrodinii]ULQ47449.1 hypothetical protein JN531_003995 [Flagellatimonas centrodinii]